MVFIVSFLPSGKWGVYTCVNIGSRFLFEKLVVRQVLERLPSVLWNRECSSPCSQQPATFHWTLSQMNIVHVLPSCFYNTPFNIFVPSTPVSFKWSVSLRFLHQHYVFLSSVIHSTCHFHLVPNSIMVITYVEHYRLCMMWYVDIWYDIWHDVKCWYMIWYMTWYDMLMYDMLYDMLIYDIWHDMIYDMLIYDI
jgi:hypothetical protein